ncbi:MAG: GCN5-related N-acetyltransferase [Mycobacterium sp.]|jgi:GNAT superfamily N-acetyltransferase|nr:GCN5-related N-acetyltransferase [Mycobacterium sp.]
MGHSVDRIRVEQIPAEASYGLRHRVLRPHQPTPIVLFPGDEDPETGTYAALGPKGELLGVATVLWEPCPWRPDVEESWRLRGMATREGRRGLGIGGAVLSAAMDHVARAEGVLLWCNARTGARRFYERAGFTVHGEPWDERELGEHIAMWRNVPPVSALARAIKPPNVHRLPDD